MEKELLYRYVQCQTSPQEENAVLEWLAADVLHERELAAIQHQHDLVALCAPTINELYTHDRRRLSMRQIRRWCAAAAAIVLLAFSGYYYHQAQELAQHAEQLLSVNVPHGQHVNLTLQDGTSVWLNAGTTLRYPALFTGRERRVQVCGEARFEVSHDARHPFIVETYACDVEVLGTKFNVVAEQGQQTFSTALFEGSVVVSSRLIPGERVVLCPSDVVRLEGNHLAVTKMQDSNEYLWTEGIINLTGRSFSELMRRFEKAFGVVIHLDREPDINIGQGKIRRSVGIDSALQVLQQFSDFDYVKDEQCSTITIK